MGEPKLYAALEAGGTKMIAAVGSSNGEPVRQIKIPTETPEKTLPALADFFMLCKSEGLGFQSLGIGSFGPIRDGVILATPKPGWEGTDLAGFFGEQLGVPVACDTDVNAAALAEARLGAGKGLRTLMYVTAGTGIGGGLCQDGKIYTGMLHPELGHIPVNTRADDQYPGCCPFHGACWEGMASGPAVEKRWKRRGEELPSGHPAWDLEAHYLAQGFLALFYTLQPDRLVFGGGLSAVPGLLEKTREEMAKLSGGYLGRGSPLEDWRSRLVLPVLANPGLTGSFLLAEAAFGA